MLDLIDSSTLLDESKEDVIVTGTEAVFGEKGIRFNVMGHTMRKDTNFTNKSEPQSLFLDLTVSETAVAQLAAKMAAAHWKRSTKSLPMDYIGSMPPALQVQIWNEHLAKIEEHSMMYRLFGKEIRGVVSQGFPRLWNTEVLDALAFFVNTIEEQGEYVGFQMDRPFVDRDSVIVPFHFDTTGTAMYRIGGSVRHGENGTSALVMESHVWRIPCRNSYIQETNFSMMHNQFRSAAEMRQFLFDALPQVLRTSSAMIRDVEVAETIRIPNFAMLLDGIAREFDLDAIHRSLMIEGAEGQTTLLGAMNAVSWLAHQGTGITREKSHRLGLFAGKLLVNDGVEMARLVLQGETGNRIRAKHN